MSAKVAADSSVEKVGAQPRIVALLALTIILVGLGLLARSVFYALSDSWMAPITLSPDNDAVVQINVRLNEQLVQLAKMRSDIERFDADVRGVDAALERLKAVQENGQKAMAWTCLLYTSRCV